MTGPTSAPARPDEPSDGAVEALLHGAEAGAGDDAVAASLRALRAAADRPVPAASDELAALLAAGLAVSDELGRRRIGRIVAGAVVAGTATLTLSGVAAAHDALPGPAQRVVTDVVNDLTPFSIRTGGPVRPPAPARPGPATIAPSQPGGTTEAAPGPPDRGRSDGGSGSATSPRHDGPSHRSRGDDPARGSGADGSGRDAAGRDGSDDGRPGEGGSGRSGPGGSSPTSNSPSHAGSGTRDGSGGGRGSDDGGGSGGSDDGGGSGGSGGGHGSDDGGGSGGR